MARYGRYGKSTQLVYRLFTVIAVEAVLLVCAVAYGISVRPQKTDADPPPMNMMQNQSTQDTDETQSDTSAEPEAEPLPEPVREKEKPEGERSGWEILQDEKVIAHAMGALGDTDYLNCLEGFQQQYAEGVRVFEADLRLTSDMQVVLRHDWRAGWQPGVSETSVPSLEEFLSLPLLDAYTPMSFKDLLLLMEEYPDICIITDTKFTDAEIVTLQFEAMLRDAEELGLSYLFDRMIIQVYNTLMYTVVDSIHHFDHYIYTLYLAGFNGAADDFRVRAEFCAENGIQGITMWDYLWRPDFLPTAEEYDLLVFTHTVNDPERAMEVLESGVSAVYTDFLTPAEITPAEEGSTDDSPADTSPEDGRPPEETSTEEASTEEASTEDDQAETVQTEEGVTEAPVSQPVQTE